MGRAGAAAPRHRSAAALRNLARAAGARSAATIDVVGTERASPIPPTVAAVLYRVAQEALTNSLRHADATTVTISLLTTDGDVRLDVIDDGTGFDTAQEQALRSGMGLFTMRERIALVDGGFELDSAPGRGTRVTASIPYRPRASDGG